MRPRGTTLASTAAPGRFLSRLTAIAAGGLALRIGYVLAFRWHERLRGDEVFYSFQANALADGLGFNNPITGRAQADHPPLTALVLTPASWVANHGVLAQRLTMVVVGTLVIIVIGLLGRQVAGPRVGLAAAALAAVYPQFWVGDGVAMSEPLAALGVAITLLFAYRLVARPTIRAAVLVGAGVGITALARPELLLLIPCVALPAALVSSGPTLRRKLGLVAAMCVATAVLLAPWIIFNLVRFERTALLSTNDGLTLAGANCPLTYYGAGTGSWTLTCLAPAPPGEQSVADAALRHDALHFARDHLNRVPLVLLTRVGRVWGLYHPIQGARFGEGEGRPNWASYLSLAAFYALVPVAVVGALRLRRRGVPLAPLLGTVVIVIATAALFWGVSRFRVPAEVSLVVLGAAALGLGREDPAGPSEGRHESTSSDPAAQLDAAGTTVAGE